LTFLGLPSNTGCRELATSQINVVLTNINLNVRKKQRKINANEPTKKKKEEKITTRSR